jgi:hypothetical protein
MAKARTAAGIAIATLALYGCTHKPAVPTINASMTGIMEPSAEKIWNIVSKAYNDIGDGLVPSKIGDADWKVIADESRKMKDRAEILADADHIVVAAANEPILGSQAVGTKGPSGAAWDAVDAKIVQARIDAKPDLFRQKMRDLVTASDAINRSSQTRDVGLLYKIASGMDETCDSCHEPFWGTDEPPAVKLPHGERLQ